MAEYLSPGVYVEEFSSGVQPMEGVSTSTAGFIGMAERGPAGGVPEFVGSFREFQRIFGGCLDRKNYQSRRFLPLAVEQFFANGGGRCFIARLLDPSAGTAELSLPGGLKFRAANPGKWGNALQIGCKRVPMKPGVFTLTASCGGSAPYAESYPEISLDPDSVYYLERALQKSLLIRAEYQPDQSGLTDLLEMFQADTLLKTCSEPNYKNKLKAVEEARAALNGKEEGTDTSAEKAALEEARTALQEEVRRMFDRIPSRKASGEILSAEEEKKQAKSEQEQQAAQARMEKARQVQKDLLQKEAQAFCTIALSGGSESDSGDPLKNLNAALLKGTDQGPGKRTGLAAFEDLPEISILAAPGVTDPAEVQEIITHCEKMNNRVCILDMPSGMNQVPELQEYRTQFSSSFAAMYHPWIQVFDPLEKAPVYLPPSGSIAGVYARSDQSRGVHKAPANEPLRSCTGLQICFGKPEQDLLNPHGVNLIRNIPGSGIRVWGARTLSDDASWKYINIRRLFIYIEESIRRNTSWAVFEPNDPLLWTRVEGTIRSFLSTLWREGALAGVSEEEAFFIQIGKGSSMTEDDILNGRMICVIGAAPVRPAEFVVFRITQIMENDS